MLSNPVMLSALIGLLCVCVAAVAFLAGAAASALFLYPQVVLMRSMLIDRQQAENLKKGVRNSVIPELRGAGTGGNGAGSNVDTPVVDNTDVGRFDMAPNDLFTARARAERDERASLRRQQEIERMLANMP